MYIYINSKFIIIIFKSIWKNKDLVKRFEKNKLNYYLICVLLFMIRLVTEKYNGGNTNSNNECNHCLH